MHRVGRTGRAGKKGTAHTLITPDEEQYAPDMVRALKDAHQVAHVTPELTALAESFKAKVAAGAARKHRSGFTGSRGFKFDDAEGASAREMARRSFEVSSGLRSVEDILADEEAKREMRDIAEDDEDGDTADAAAAAAAKAARATATTGVIAVGAGIAAVSGAPASTPAASAAVAPAPKIRVPAEAAQLAVLRAKLASARAAVSAGVGAADAADKAAAELAEAETLGILVPAPIVAAPAPPPLTGAAAVKAAAAAAAAISKELGLSGSAADMVVEELEFNDYPDKARKLMWRAVPDVRDAHGGEVTIVTKGVHIEGRRPAQGERKLYLHIEGPREGAVRAAKRALLRILEEETLRAGAALDRPGALPAGGGSYAKFLV